MNDFIRLLPFLKGAAISTLLLFLLDPGRAWQQKEVALLTGYSLKSVAMGLEQLKLHALANFHGKSNGWALSDGVKQLEFIHTALLGVDNSLNSVDNSGDNFPASLGESTPQHGKFTHCLPPNTENLRIAPPSTYTRTRTRVFSSSSLNSFKKSFGKKKKKEESAPQHGNFTDSTPLPSWGAREWLIYAGVGQNSPALGQLSCLDVGYVKAHVLALKEKNEPVNWLIQRLRSGDAPPPAPKPKDYIPEHLQDIIKR